MASFPSKIVLNKSTFPKKYISTESQPDIKMFQTIATIASDQK